MWLHDITWMSHDFTSKTDFRKESFVTEKRPCSPDKTVDRCCLNLSFSLPQAMCYVCVCACAMCECVSACAVYFLSMHIIICVCANALCDWSDKQTSFNHEWNCLLYDCFTVWSVAMYMSLRYHLLKSGPDLQRSSACRHASLGMLNNALERSRALVSWGRGETKTVVYQWMSWGGPRYRSHPCWHQFIFTSIMQRPDFPRQVSGGG